MTPKRLFKISVLVAIAGVVLGLVASSMTGPKTEEALFAAPEQAAPEAPFVEIDEAPATSDGFVSPEGSTPEAKAPEPQDEPQDEGDDEQDDPEEEQDEPDIDPIPADLDSDGDGLTDEEEAKLGTDPKDSDTDNDFYSDFTEYEAGTDPLDKSDHPNNDIQLP